MANFGPLYNGYCPQSECVPRKFIVYVRREVGGIVLPYLMVSVARGDVRDDVTMLMLPCGDKSVISIKAAVKCTEFAPVPE